MTREGTLAIITEIAGALVIPGSSWAMGYQAFDWVAAPRGTNVAMACVKTGEEQIRVNYTQYTTPTWQRSTTLTRDMSASGQFKQDFGLILRVAKVF